MKRTTIILCNAKNPNMPITISVDDDNIMPFSKTKLAKVFLIGDKILSILRPDHQVRPALAV